MSHSVSPLGSLSSPSPSPPPNPIDESELSELTDDDHDSKIVDDRNPELDEDNEDEDEDVDVDDPPPPRSRKTPSANPRKRQRPGLARKSFPANYSPRTASAPSSSKRKKRGGLVPAPMWDWAYKNAAPGSSTSAPTPGHCLSPSTSAAPLAGPSRPFDADSETGPLPPSKPKSTSASPDAEEEEEEEELPTPPRAMEEEEGEEADLRKDRSVDRKHSQRRGPARWGKPRKKVVVPMPFDRTKVPRSKRGIRFMPRISLYQNDMMLKRIWEQGYKIYDPNAPTSDEEDDQDDIHVENDEDDDSSSNSDEDEMDVDEDEDAEEHDLPFPRQSPIRPTLNANINSPHHSTSVIDLGADNPSVPPSIRASVDPTMSPPDEDVRPGVIPDEDMDRDHDPDALVDDHHPAPDGDVEADGDEDEDAQPEEPSQPPSPTPIAEPEPEPEDEDPDLQPAHRAEALDVLATIELKFALLRERVYVEKMEGLAWEEALVWDGTHPELHHLQSELTKRRDKRLMLASKKRTYEIQAVTRKRREEEAWCWEGWDIARTELQSEMIAETNRKRRKLERERRTVERPSAARRIPNAILNPPPAPTLRQIANAFSLPSHLSRLASSRKASYVKGLSVYPGLDGLSGTTAYPDLLTLSPHDIAADLDFLFQHRRMGYGFGMGFGPPMGVPVGMGVAFNNTTTGFGPAAMGFGGATPNPGFGVNGLGIGGLSETYPPNPGSGIIPGSNTTQIGGPTFGLGGSGAGLGPLAQPGPSSAPSQNTPNAIAGSGSMPGQGIANTDGPSFPQPAMGVFQGPSIGTGPTGYPLGSGVGGTSIVIGPGGTTSTPVIGPGGARIQRPSGFAERERELQKEREREMAQRDRDIRERELPSRDRELAIQREREMREREREFGPNMGPGYPAWGSKPTGGTDWGIGDARRKEEKERIERNERDRERERSQVQSIVPTPTHRHSHHHPHPYSHGHQLQQHLVQPPHQPHPVHANQSHSHSQHLQHHHPHGQHLHQHTQHQHGTSHAQPHHHVTPHHHHRHHHHVVHHHHSGASSSGPDGTSPLLQGSTPAAGVQTMEIINLSANPSSKPHWKKDETKLGGSSMPGSRPPSTHPLPSSHSHDERERERERDRDRDRERDRPIATPFVLAPSHHTISAASSPRHGWTPGPSEPGPANTSAPSAPFALPPERFHTPVPHRFSNLTPNGLSSQLPRPLTTSPPRVPPTSVSTSSPSISAMNVPPPSSTGPFSLQRKPSPALPKLGIPSLGYSPRLAGPGVVPPTGPGIPGVLSTSSGGPGVTSSGILTSGPGIPPGPGIAPALGVSGPPGESSAPSLFTGSRTTSPLIPYTGAPPVVAVSTQRVGVDGS